MSGDVAERIRGGWVKLSQDIIPPTAQFKRLQEGKFKGQVTCHLTGCLYEDTHSVVSFSLWGPCIEM